MLAAIVDDGEKDAATLSAYVAQFAKETGVDLRSVRYPHAAAFLADDTAQFSLVIMDIDMPGVNGMEAARMLRADDPDVVIMFVTNMPQYALEGYEVEAVDYVVKPVGYGEFRLKLKKALRYVGKNRERAICLRVGGEDVRLSVWDVLYVESNKHYLTYRTAGGSYTVRQTMAEAERSLARLCFARCNSGYLVNLRHVRRIAGDAVTVGDAELPVSRSRRAGFLEAYARFVGGI